MKRARDIPNGSDFRGKSIT